MLRVLYLGDIMGRPGREVIIKHLPRLKKQYTPDLVIAQAENVTHGKGMSPIHMRELQQAGIHCFTGGNHTIERPAILGELDNPLSPVLAPINQPGVKPSWGTKIIATHKGNVRVVSLLGTIFPNLAEPMHNPLLAIDELLAQPTDCIATVVNFHGDFSSEKRVIGYYLDGQVAAVIGDHWHVPTNDALVLPKGTAHITDVGMCGTLHSSLGVSKETIIARWRDGVKNKNDIAEGGSVQLNGVVVDITLATGLAKDIVPINLIFDV